MVSRIAFEEIQGFDENKFFGEDFDFVCRASKKYRFGINRKVKIIISTRRFEKEGIFNLFWKYVRSEIQILVKGNVDENSIEYEFGNFDCDKSCEKKKVIR